MQPARFIVFFCAGAVLAAPVKFNRDIRPIMSDTCFRCHGPDKSSRMAGMRLDLREEATRPTKSGVIPIVPGDPDKSAIIQRIFAANPKVMPPKYAHKDLTPAQKDTIRRWVAEGAQYEGHWAYTPVARPAVPEVPANPQAPVHNPIDAFLQDRLAKEGLQPSPEADRRTLIRRLSFDLVGLPPTPEEVASFEQDTSPDAYTKLVDRLMASPRYAEKQAMHWLDAIRYADSAGFHGDNLLPAWPYRDYVLRAFRDNKPFDQFTREQMAGDLMPNPTIEDKIASAYNRMNRTSAEGGLQPKEYLAKYGADRVRTTSTVWLGSTMGCAECHDHKFDPFLSKDFYSMKAFFADIEENGLVADRGENNWGSKMSLPSPDQAAKLQALDQRIEQASNELKQRASNMVAERREWEKRLLKQYEAGELAWKFQRPISAESAHGAKLTILGNQPFEQNFYVGGTLVSEKKPSPGLVVASGPNPDNETYTVRFKPGAGAWRALGIEVFQDESLPGNRMARGSDRFILSEVEASVDGRKLGFSLATSEKQGEYSQTGAMAAIDGDPSTGWGVAFTESRNPFLALRLAQPVQTTADSVITVRLHHDSDLRKAVIGRFRLAMSGGEYSWPQQGDSTAKKKSLGEKTIDECLLTVDAEHGLPAKVLEALKLPEEKRDDAQKQKVLDHFMWAAAELEPQTQQLAKLEIERGVLKGQIPQVVITKATEPRETRVLPRGDFLNETGEIVQPAIPRFLGALNTGGRRANRLDLANWIVSTSNPLTARVYVNRLWREFFGTGLSKVLEDMGSQGEWPTHLELLDWMASEFMQPSFAAEGAHAWDMKHIVRTIVLSHAYRQASTGNAPAEERDPDNRLIARQSRFRVDAEVVHDTALFVSGLLKERFGGPSVNPYEPAGYLAAMNFSKREYSASHGDDLYRRGIYTTWQRTFLHPSFAAFDAPTREECTVNRINSNTPQQALTLLNDPIYVEAARVFAQNILEHGGASFDKRLDWAFLHAIDRKPTVEERVILTSLYKKDLARFQAAPANAREFIATGESAVPAQLKAPGLAAMATLARAILNMHETITRN